MIEEKQGETTMETITENKPNRIGNQFFGDIKDSNEPLDCNCIINGLIKNQIIELEEKLKNNAYKLFRLASSSEKNASNITSAMVTLDDSKVLDGQIDILKKLQDDLQTALQPTIAA